MSEKFLTNLVKGFIGICLLLFFLFAVVINPGVNADSFSSETLWEAVHPFNWIYDTVGTVGFVAVALYVAGFLGKAVYAFTEPKSENSSGLVHVVAAVGFLSIILIFI